MSELAEFLRARIAEDETAAVGRAQGAPIHQVGCFYYEHSISPRVWTAAHCDCEDEAKVRALAECEAKRRIVALWTDGIRDNDPDTRSLIGAVQAIALPYADHPDYDPAWA